MEKTDYTLTNQSEADFSGQDLEGSSFAGAVVRNADFSGAKLHGAIFTQGLLPAPTSPARISAMC